MNEYKCPICNGTGFKDGKICTCISKKADDGLEALKSLFGDVFKDNGPKKGESSEMS